MGDNHSITCPGCGGEFPPTGDEFKRHVCPAIRIEHAAVTIICLLICGITFLWVTLLPIVGLLYVLGLLD